MERSAVETGSILLESRVARVSTAEKKSLKLRLSYVICTVPVTRRISSIGREHNETGGLPGDATCPPLTTILHLWGDRRNKIERIWGISQVCVLRWLVERDCENGFVFLWREELKFKLRYVRIMNTCWNKVWVFFFLERGSWNFWKNHVRMIAGTKVKMVVYFRGDFGEKFFAKVGSIREILPIEQ